MAYHETNEFGIIATFKCTRCGMECAHVVSPATIRQREKSQVIIADYVGAEKEKAKF